MTNQPFWTRRLFVFAASTVVAAGSAVLNVAAFAAVHGTPQVTASDHQWQCITAPCNPPEDDATRPTAPGDHQGHHHVWECFAAPCNPPSDDFPPPNPAPVGTPAGAPDDAGMRFKGGLLT
ncbi:hypothetical protein [Streptomyces sp. NPDC059708]|uniref:hypothetical protein n=1 Tax=Streptomyces sp. NPDC059708 TaxID=3346916 RepID=UPI0036AF9A8E